MRYITITLAAVACIALAANAAVVLPYTAGSANGYQSTAGMNDAQPASVPTLGTTTDDFGNSFGFYTTNPRAVYVDFGSDYALVDLQQVIIGLKQYGTDPSGTPSCFWSEDPDEEFDGTDVAAPNLFFGWTAASSSKSWQQIWSGSVTPAHQYYIVAFDGTQGWSNRPQEVVIAGVPEPATMALLGLGVIGLLRRRR